MNSVEGSVCIDAGVPNHPQKEFSECVFFTCLDKYHLVRLSVGVCACGVCMLIAKLFWIKPRAIKTQGILQRKSNATHREFPELGIGAVLTNQNDVKKDVACFFKNSS